MLPGAMLRNANLHFHCEHVRQGGANRYAVHARVLDRPSAEDSRRARWGNYYAEPDVLERIEKNRQVIFRYVDAAGRPRLLRTRTVR